MSDLAIAPAHDRRKELGAFYTPPEMARTLVEWAVREPTDSVLDPSFGGLVFLAASEKRLGELGAGEVEIADQVFGVDLDQEAYLRALLIHEERGAPAPTLVQSDFFDVSPADMPPLQAVVGNPPYVRYQSFNGAAVRARQLAAAAGVELSRLASSWAPFVIHATSFLAPGGRLAQVLPAELLHAQYARPVVEFLRREFATVDLVVFDGRVFPGALEEVVLVLAEGRGTAEDARIRVLPYEALGNPETYRASGPTAASGEPIEAGALLAQLLPTDTRSLYGSLDATAGVARLGDLASVDIGIVTGANGFFLLGKDDAATLDRRLLSPAIGKAQQIPGARISKADHRRLLRTGGPGLMFTAAGSSPRKAMRSADHHIAAGREAGFHERYKCRIRDPWWELPLPADGPAELLLTYFANEHPRLVLNEAGVLTTNTVHGVRPRDPDLAPALAAGFYNSLTLLSAELVGRSYGGGVLKLEPSEAEALLVPPLDPGLADLLGPVDEAIRARSPEAALDLVDAETLGPLGLGKKEIARLREAREYLRARRRRRGRPARAA